MSAAEIKDKRTASEIGNIVYNLLWNQFDGAWIGQWQIDGHDAAAIAVAAQKAAEQCAARILAE